MSVRCCFRVESIDRGQQGAIVKMVPITSAGVDPSWFGTHSAELTFRGVPDVDVDRLQLGEEIYLDMTFGHDHGARLDSRDRLDRGDVRDVRDGRDGRDRDGRDGDRGRRFDTADTAESPNDARVREIRERNARSEQAGDVRDNRDVRDAVSDEEMLRR